MQCNCCTATIELTTVSSAKVIRSSQHTHTEQLPCSTHIANRIARLTVKSISSNRTLQTSFPWFLVTNRKNIIDIIKNYNINESEREREWTRMKGSRGTLEEILVGGLMGHHLDRSSGCSGRSYYVPWWLVVERWQLKISRQRSLLWAPLWAVWQGLIPESFHSSRLRLSTSRTVVKLVFSFNCERILFFQLSTTIPVYTSSAVLPYAHTDRHVPQG